MKSIAVFCGANPGNHPAYMQIARETGAFLARQGIRVVYGGASIGMMGAIADGALEQGGEVIGVIPDFMTNREINHKGLTRLVIVSSMNERKLEMARLSDGFIALPGGYGTLDELFEMITLVQIEQASYPIGILNANGFYDYLLAHIQHMEQTGFLRQRKPLFQVSDNLEGLLADMRRV
ncbi:MAG: TIGR00730 family Rossman fold protein [Lewinellaceae bacterium]|nr:TIGR00730 family Rossman fold protein [Lewinellaceae bacterium]